MNITDDSLQNLQRHDTALIHFRTQTYQCMTRRASALFELSDALTATPAQTVAVLATYLGHVSLASTFWYLTATPQLLELTATKVAAALQEGRLL